ncbi:hypothetical protein XELAEV_18035681mg [Xenopus laevis]|uniref:Uncharacterized protein n=1 Tax=Xenopus laevis TaxID=8355 RepID=A0A974CG24_XENLA|nr:hypothetical protein XELAEV_18035681mg [Xenopus laevis]
MYVSMVVISRQEIWFWRYKWKVDFSCSGLILKDPIAKKVASPNVFSRIILYLLMILIYGNLEPWTSKLESHIVYDNFVSRYYWNLQEWKSGLLESCVMDSSFVIFMQCQMIVDYSNEMHACIDLLFFRKYNFIG